MSIATSTNAAFSTLRRLVGLGLLASAAVGSAGAQQPFRPGPKFEGKSIPEPPAQGRPWTAPRTKLPRFLVDATAALFEQGVADPRDCEYRNVEIGDRAVVKTSGFVLPGRADAPGRFVVCWDGLVHPALTVGEPADLDGEVKDLAAAMSRNHEAARPNSGRDEPRPFPGGGWGRFTDAGVDAHPALKLCILLRLGRADLAEALFAAATNWKPEARRLTGYGISYLTLANDWAGSEFTRLADAHERGDDVIALDAARRLARFRDLAAAKADAMGFPPGNPSGPFGGGGVASRFGFLHQLDDLLRDQERRAKAPPREPAPPRGGDPAPRVAALIRDLDQIGAEPMMMAPAGVRPGGGQTVNALIAEGDPAVGPLLDVLASDDRLTRSVDGGGLGFGRGPTVNRLVHPVHEFAFNALVGILKTGEFNGRRPSPSWAGNADPTSRKELADSMRAFWEKERLVPLTERWYRNLLDDKAAPDRWLEAAAGITGLDVPRDADPAFVGPRPMRGAPLRDGREPSVAALILRRARKLELTEGSVNSGLGSEGACRMGFMLADWDGKGSIPLLKELSKLCRERSDLWRGRKDAQAADPRVARSLLGLIEARVRFGDAEALDEYADWLGTTSPRMVQHGGFELWRPLVAHRDRPAMAAAARRLFKDPESPWVPLLPEARDRQWQPFGNFIASQLITVAAFREGVLDGLADRAPLGTIARRGEESIEYKFKGGATMTQSPSNFGLEDVEVGAEHPFRNCDYLALKLSDLEGCPRIDLFWPGGRRDAALAACAAYLKRFGDRFTTESPPGAHDFPNPKGHLAFPTLKRPATRADVDAGRAIFSLEGQGETRVVDLPGGLPRQAKWVTLKDTPIVLIDQNGPRRAFRTEGHVWQVEEVRKGDAWERWYGFVGQHTVGRAPAAEIELVGEIGR